MHRHTTLLFLLLLMLLIILCGGINSKDINSFIPWGEFQPSYDAQIKHLSNDTSPQNQPHYFNEYKWIVEK